MDNQTGSSAPASEFDTAQVIAYWLTEAEEALRVAYHLIEKEDYSYALFFGHLAIEKALKAAYASHLQEHAPPTHNLLRLARLAGLQPDEAQTQDLIAITAFNIETRYPDFKRSFRRACTANYSYQQMTRIEEIYQWVRSQIR